MPDRGLWVTWYNLAEKDRDAHLASRHGTCLPQLLERLHAPQSPVVARRIWPAVK